MQDPHQVLGVSQNASEEEIRQAYRRLAKRYHPDLHPGDASAAARMNEINAAYDRLKNPESYDRQSPGPNPGAYENPYRDAAYQSYYYYTADPFRTRDGQEGGDNRRYTYHRRVRPGRIILFFIILSLLYRLLLGVYSSRLSRYYYPQDGQTDGYSDYYSDYGYGQSPYDQSGQTGQGGTQTPPVTGAGTPYDA